MYTVNFTTFCNTCGTRFHSREAEYDHQCEGTPPCPRCGEPTRYMDSRPARPYCEGCEHEDDPAPSPYERGWWDRKEGRVSREYQLRLAEELSDEAWAEYWRGYIAQLRTVRLGP